MSASIAGSQAARAQPAGIPGAYQQ